MMDEFRGMYFAPHSEIFKKCREISEKYGNLPQSEVIDAFSRVSENAFRLNPFIQNNRVKAISSRPSNYSKQRVSEMVLMPQENEAGLRQVAHELEYTAYPIYHVRRIYQDVLTYHSYISPCFADKEETKRDDFWREWKLLEKFRAEIDPKTTAHMIAGQAIVEGKVFYYPRFSIDKPHNKVNYAFMQQLPSDWTKIVGFNNKSKYTIAFNLMYFQEPGADPRQFGKLFEPYMSDYNREVEGVPAGTGKSVIYASGKVRVNLDRVKEDRAGRAKRNQADPDVYYQNGEWFYWVTLPVDEVFTFEADDVNPTVVSPFTGLYIDIIQLAQLEQIQLELVQNPLVSLMHGEIPYFDDKSSNNNADAYKLSNAGQMLFDHLFYEMLEKTNTGGIGLYMAPLQNMRLETLAESPSAMDIVSKGYQDTMSKAGMGGIIPTNGDPKAGLAQISSVVEERFAERVYADYTRMMEALIGRMGLKYNWKFNIFGSIFGDEKAEERAMKGMEHGILSETLTYLALRDRTIFEDFAISDAVIEGKLMDRRIPLVASYNAGSGGVSPQQAHDNNPGGRPSSDGEATSDGQENDIDAGV